jgi:hypothetical protein
VPNIKMAALRCPRCGAPWDLFQCGDFYELVPQIAPCESYEAVASQVCRPIFEAAYEACLEIARPRPTA